jgi:rhomboid protease GluP
LNEDEFLDRLHARVSRIWLTYALISMCVVVFAFEMWRSKTLWTVPGEVLLALGADFGPKVQAGQAWRLFSAIFLHGNPLHIALNMFALWQVGYFIERIFGRSGMLLLFIASGVMGSLASVWWRAQGMSVGASGAIFGLFGALLVWLIRRRHEVPLGIFKQLRSGTLGFICYSLFAGVALPGIDNAAHLGGLLGGMLLGAGMAAPLGRPAGAQWRRWPAWLALAAVIVCAGGLWRTAPQVAVTWQQHVEFSDLVRDFGLQDAQLEQQLQSLMKDLSERRTSRVDAARQLENDMLPAWRVEADRLAALDVAPADETRKAALVHYASFRYEALQMIARGLVSGQRRWFELAAQRQLEAQAALLNSRPRAGQ